MEDLNYTETLRIFNVKNKGFTLTKVLGTIVAVFACLLIVFGTSMIISGLNRGLVGENEFNNTWIGQVVCIPTLNVTGVVNYASTHNGITNLEIISGTTNGLLGPKQTIDARLVKKLTAHSTGVQSLPGNGPKP